MDLKTRRKQRMEQLLGLAQAYQGWSRKELARAVGRDPTKLIPGSGIPKLDLVVDLAKLLDWPIGQVAGDLWIDEASTADEPGSGYSNVPTTNGATEPTPEVLETVADFDQLDEAAVQSQRDGRYTLAVNLARKAYACAPTPPQRALACNREAVAWDGLGQHTSALEAEQRGLLEPSIPTDLRLMLESNLANTYYTLWSLAEARSLARDLIDFYDDEPPTRCRDRATQAFAYYVRGHAMRRLITTEPGRAQPHAERAKTDLETSSRLYRELAKELDEESYAGIANTCVGGIIEAEVTLGLRDAKSALDELAGGLDSVVDPRQCPAGDWLESYGWWCIFGCNIALRDVSDERDLQHHMAIFTNKADEIADRMNSWSLRERVFTMQYASHQRFVDWTGQTVALTLDNDDLRALVGTMGRFPAFRETGWRLLQTARVVRKG